MVSFKLTALLAAATVFLGASAHTIPDSNLPSIAEGLIPRADNTPPASDTPPGRWGKHGKAVKEKIHKWTGGRLRVKSKGKQDSGLANNHTSEGEVKPADDNSGDAELPPSKASGGRLGRMKEKAHELTGNRFRKGNKGSQVANDRTSEDEVNPAGDNSGDAELRLPKTSGGRLKKKFRGLRDRLRGKSGKSSEEDKSDPGDEDDSPMDDSANDEEDGGEEGDRM